MNIANLTNSALSKWKEHALEKKIHGEHSCHTEEEEEEKAKKSVSQYFSKAAEWKLDRVYRK